MNLFDNVYPQKTCSFTGPRPEKLDISPEILYNDLSLEITKLAHNGYTHFFTGMSRGFDLISAQAVLDLEHSLGISLICAIPFSEQAVSWSNSDKKTYNNILSRARHTICMSNSYFPTVFYARNRLLVDNCSKIITYYKKSRGGTKYTLDYARTKNIDIINLASKSQQVSFEI